MPLKLNKNQTFRIVLAGVGALWLLLQGKKNGDHAPGSTGTLIIDTIPTGANVSLKEGLGVWETKGVTPLTLILKADTMYAWKFTKSGYEDSILPSGYAVENGKTRTLTWPLMPIGSQGGQLTYSKPLVLPYPLSRNYPPPYGETGFGVNVGCRATAIGNVQLNITITAEVYNVASGFVISTFSETFPMNISDGATVALPWDNRIVIVGNITDGKVFFREGEAVKVVITDAGGGRSGPGTGGPGSLASVKWVKG